MLDQLPGASTWRSEVALREALQEIGGTLELLTLKESQSGNGPVKDAQKTRNLLSFPKAKMLISRSRAEKEGGRLHWIKGANIPNTAHERVAATQAALKALHELIIQNTSSSMLPTTTATSPFFSHHGGSSPNTTTKNTSSPHLPNSKNAPYTHKEFTIPGEISSLGDPRPSTSYSHCHPPCVSVPHADLSMRRAFQEVMGSCFKAPLLRCLEFSMGNISQLAVEVIIGFFQSARDARVVESLSNTFAAPLLRLIGSGKPSLRQAARTAVRILLSTQFGSGALSETIKAAYQSPHPRVRSGAYHGLLYAFQHRQHTPAHRALMAFLPALTQLAHYGLTEEPHPMVRPCAARMFWGLWVLDAIAAQHVLRDSPFFSSVREQHAIETRLMAERVAALRILGVVLQPPSSSMTSQPYEKACSSSLCRADGGNGWKNEENKEGWSLLFSVLQGSPLSNISRATGNREAYAPLFHTPRTTMSKRRDHPAYWMPLHSSTHPRQWIDRALAVTKAKVARRGAPTLQERDIPDTPPRGDAVPVVPRASLCQQGGRHEGRVAHTAEGAAARRQGSGPPWPDRLSSEPFLNAPVARSREREEKWKRQASPACLAKRCEEEDPVLGVTGGSEGRKRKDFSPRLSPSEKDRWMDHHGKGREGGKKVATRREDQDLMMEGKRRLRTPPMPHCSNPASQSGRPPTQKGGRTLSSPSSSLSDVSSLFPMVAAPALPVRSPFPHIDFDRFTSFWYQLPCTSFCSTFPASRNANENGKGGRHVGGWMGGKGGGRVRYCFRSVFTPQYEWEPDRITASYRAYAHDIREMQHQCLAMMREHLMGDKSRDDGAIPVIGEKEENAKSYRSTSSSCRPIRRRARERKTSPTTDALFSLDDHAERLWWSERQGREGRWRTERHLAFGMGEKRAKEGQAFQEEEVTETGEEVSALIRACLRLWREYRMGVRRFYQGEEIKEGRMVWKGSGGKEFAPSPSDVAAHAFGSRPAPSSLSYAPPFSLFVVSSMEAILLDDLDVLHMLGPSRGLQPTSICERSFSDTCFSPKIYSFTTDRGKHIPMEEVSLLDLSRNVCCSGDRYCCSTTPGAATRSSVLQRVQQHVRLLSLLIHIVFRQRLLTGRKSSVFLRLNKGKADGALHKKLPSGTLVSGGRLFPKKNLSAAVEEEEEDEEVEEIRGDGRMSTTERVRNASLQRAMSPFDNQRRGGRAPQQAHCTACGSSSSPPYSRSKKKERDGREDASTRVEEEDRDAVEMTTTDHRGSARRVSRQRAQSISSSPSFSLSPRPRGGSRGAAAQRRSFKVGKDENDVGSLRRTGAVGGRKEFWLVWSGMGRLTRMEEQEKEEMCYRSLESIFSRLVHRLNTWMEEGCEPYSGVRRVALEVLQSLLLASCNHSLPSFSFPLRLQTLCGPILRLFQRGMDDASEEVRQTAVRCLYSLLFAPSVPLDTSLDGLSACLEQWLTPPAIYTSTAGYRELLLCVGRLLEWERRRQDRSLSGGIPLSSHDPLVPGGHTEDHSSLPMVIGLTRQVVQRLIHVLHRLLVHHVVKKVQEMSATVLVVLQWAVVEAREMVEEMFLPSEMQMLVKWAELCDTWPEIW